MNVSKYIAVLLAAVTAIPSVCAGELDAEYGAWKFTLGTNKQMLIEQDGKTLLKGVYMTALDADGSTLQSNQYGSVAKKEENVDDAFGSGMRITWTYTQDGKPSLEQVVTVYPALPYAVFEGAVVAASGTTSSCEICPIVSSTTTTLPLETSDNRVYNMPFANDNWATFSAVRWSTGQPVTSCEATALFNVASRKGIVIGSVDHSVWKSSVTVTPNGSNRIRKCEVKAGYVSPRTWDNGSFGNNSPIDRHGAVKGTRVASPRFMIGLFDDWRDGLETYGKANTVLCPKLKIKSGDKSFFGWQSWGGMEAQLNYTSAMSLLDFFEQEIKPTGFSGEDGACWIVLDSFWDNMSRMERRQFAARCKELGFHPGIYHTPFSLWCGDDSEISDYPFATVDGKTYSRKDVVLTANGKPRKISAYSLDPTHPAVREVTRQRFEEFKNDGFEFVKIDFMNNGSQEADKWFLPEITTGMMAYNYGMDYILEFAGDMVIDYSIAPVFPAKAHIRRIGCDAWGELNNSMYTLNCIEGSWWLDQCYSFNDPDHMCLSKVFTGKGSPDEQEARIRYTCGLITGMTLLGGTYAYDGQVMKYNGKDVKIIGTDAERARAVKFASNKDLTEVGRLGRSFRPVEGTFKYQNTLYSTNDISCGNEFVLDTPRAFYYVVFNYGTDGQGDLNYTPDFERLGVDPSEFIGCKELFEGKTLTPSTMQVSVPKKDVRIYRFERSDSGAESAMTDPSGSVTARFEDGNVVVVASEPIKSVQLYSMQGMLLNRSVVSDGSREVSIKAFPETTVAMVSVCLSSGISACRKLLVR